jgi:hypothetical protein
MKKLNWGNIIVMVILFFTLLITLVAMGCGYFILGTEKYSAGFAITIIFSIIIGCFSWSEIKNKSFWFKDK